MMHFISIPHTLSFALWIHCFVDWCHQWSTNLFDMYEVVSFEPNYLPKTEPLANAPFVANPYTIITHLLICYLRNIPESYLYARFSQTWVLFPIL